MDPKSIFVRDGNIHNRYSGVMDGLGELSRRVTQLDDELGSPPVASGSSSDLIRFVTVLERVTSTGTVGDVGQLSCVAPADADALLDRCRLLARLLNTVPEIVVGPLLLDSQYWIATGKPSHLPRGESILSEPHFIGLHANTPVSTKPFGIGLFTSTGVLGTYGMWRIYLDLHRGSTLWSLPWHTWAVKPRREAVICEIASASQWVDFVRSYPLRDSQLIYPNWRSVARDYDAVHMTLRTICAIQGLYFPTEQGIVAASYWDIESTLWLRWCFSSLEPVEVTDW